MREKLNLLENFTLQEFLDFLLKSSLMDLSCWMSPLVLCCFNSDGDFYYVSIDSRRDGLFYVYVNITVTTMNRLSLC